MTPPELAADTPVLNVLQPVTVSIFIFLWIEFHLASHYRGQGDVGKVLHPEEPLKRETGFDGGIGVTLGVSHLIDVILNLFHQSCGLQVFGNLLATIHTVHAHIKRRLIRDGSISIEDIDSLQIMRLTQHVVVCVMSGSYLQTTSTELNVNIAVLDNRDNTVNQWNNHLSAL